MLRAGTQTDNGIQRVRVLPVGRYLEQHPGHVVELRVMRPGDAEYYIPADTEIVNGMLMWTPNEVDTARAGIGSAQVWARDGAGVVGAIGSKVGVMFAAGLTDVPVDFSEPMRLLMDKVLDEAAVIRVTAQDVHADREAADQSASTAQQALMELRTGIASGDFKGDPGDPGFSPTAKVERTDNGAKITIIDKDGTTTAEVLDGQGGGSSYDDTELRNRIGTLETDKADKSDIPTVPKKLPNPYALTFTGEEGGSYDGSASKTINIPQAYDDTVLAGRVSDVEGAVGDLNRDLGLVKEELVGVTDAANALSEVIG